MPRAEIRPIGHLCVDVVRVLASPGRQFAVVGRPDALQGNRWGAATRSRTEKVVRQIVLLLDGRVRQRHAGCRPERLPPCQVPAPRSLPTGVQRHGDSFPGKRQRLRVVAARRDADCNQGRTVYLAGARRNHVLHLVGGVLHEPFDHRVASTVLPPLGGRFVAQFLHDARRDDLEINRPVARNTHQCHQLHGAEENLKGRRASKMRPAGRRGQIQPEGFERLRFIQVQFDASCGQLRRIGELRRVELEQFEHLFVFLFGHKPAQRGVVPVGVTDLLGHTAVPDVPAVERELHVPPLTPEQPAQEPVAQRHGLVPSLDRGSQCEIGFRQGRLRINGTGVVCGRRELETGKNHQYAQYDGKPCAVQTTNSVLLARLRSIHDASPRCFYGVPWIRIRPLPEDSTNEIVSSSGMMRSFVKASCHAAAPALSIRIGTGLSGRRLALIGMSRPYRAMTQSTLGTAGVSAVEVSRLNGTWNMNPRSGEWTRIANFRVRR